MSHTYTPAESALISAAPEQPIAAQTEVPQGFIDYVQANYHGTVEFERPEWHADRLWRAAMHQLKVAQSIASSATTEDDKALMDAIKHGTSMLRQNADGTRTHIPYAEIYAQPIADVSAPTDERGLFEAHCQNVFSATERTKDGTYFYATTRTAWLAWQAARAAAAPVSGPTEDTLTKLHNRVKEMQEAAYTFGEYSKEAVSAALDGVLDEIAAISAAPVSGQGASTWEWAPDLKLADDEVIHYSQIYQTAEGLPVMTDSGQHSTWNVASVFKRAADGVDYRNPVRILAVEPSAYIDSRPDIRYPLFSHPDDSAVDRFAAAMKIKMAESRAKGRSGWDNEVLCPAERLQSMLCDHVAKGDPVDVGNFAMMLFNRGERTIDSRPRSEDSRAEVADFIEKRAQEYLDGNAGTEHDTGAITWHYGEAGRDYYNTLTELAEEIRALASTTPQKADNE